MLYCKGFSHLVNYPQPHLSKPDRPITFRLQVLYWSKRILPSPYNATRSFNIAQILTSELSLSTKALDTSDFFLPPRYPTSIGDSANDPEEDSEMGLLKEEGARRKRWVAGTNLPGGYCWAVMAHRIFVVY